MFYLEIIFIFTPGSDLLYGWSQHIHLWLLSRLWMTFGLWVWAIPFLGGRFVGIGGTPFGNLRSLMAARTGV